jgi:inhibitor of KinA
MKQPILSTYLISDTALTLSFDLPIGDEAHNIVMQAALVIKELIGNEYCDIVPAYTSLTIYFSDASKLSTTIETIKKEITKKITTGFFFSEHNRKDKTQKEDIIQIPVCYEQPLATDIEEVIHHLQLTSKEIIQLHTSSIYKAYMNGFVPGFSYMGALDPSLHLPRKKTPSPKVAAGSVAIAAAQTGIYPFESAGGWYIIGRTPLTMFNKKRNPVCLLQPGQQVQFYSISSQEYNNWL